MFSHYVTYFNS